MSKNQNLVLIVDFLSSININLLEQKLSNKTFLPGLSLLGNTILMDQKKLTCPGDLLHEAGHIATTEEKLRPLIGTAKMEEN